MISLERRLIGTDRGDLYLGKRYGEDALFRLLDRGLVNADFRAQVDDLVAALAKRPAPRVLQIVHHDFSGDHYYIQYRLPGVAQAIPEFFGQIHWLTRLRFVEGIVSVYGAWQKRIPVPLGPHGGRVVACRVAGHWVAHLAPCPPLALRSPLDLLNADREVLAAAAPETLRGVPAIGVAEDVYSAATLVLQALGICPLIGGPDKEACIEAQARVSPNQWDLRACDVEGSLWQIPSARELLSELGLVARQCSVFSPAGRPPDMTRIRTALQGVLAFEEAAVVATELKENGRPREALDVLEWRLRNPLDEAEKRRIHRMAAELSSELGMPAQELKHIEKLLTLSKGETVLERRRMEIRCDAYFKKTPNTQVGAPDAEGEWLLQEIERLRQRLPDDDPIVKEDRLRSARICWRTGDLSRRAAELYALTQLDEGDVDAWDLYGLAYREYACQSGLDRNLKDAAFKALDQLVRFMEVRLKRLNEAGLISDEEKKTWIERFQSLRQPC
jgi:hypothetical protein